MSAFTLDITTDPRSAFEGTPLQGGALADVASLMFVLSALKPDDFRAALTNAWNALKNDAVLIMRDYAVNDMAMLRYVRQTLKIKRKMPKKIFLEVFRQSKPTGVTKTLNFS